MTSLRVEPLSAEAFAPLGHVVERPGGEPDATGPGWRWWGETALVESDGRAHSIGYLALTPAPLRFDWAERHMRSAEVVAPLERECLLYAGPPEYADEPGRLPPLERFRVFRVSPGQAVVLGKGVWHGAPLAVDEPGSALVLLLEGTGRDDTHVARFAQTPVEIRS